MKLHTNLISTAQVFTALNRVINEGNVASGVFLYVFEDKGSRSHHHAFEIQLGCEGKVKGDKRGWKNSGQYGAADTYAATYAEWGWFIARLFEIDAEAVFGPYKGVEDFHHQTAFMFAASVPQPDPYPYIIPGVDRRRYDAPSPYIQMTFAPRVDTALVLV